MIVFRRDNLPCNHRAALSPVPISIVSRMTASLEKLIYSVGIDLTGSEAIVPIGAGCKICDRPACPQRAFPFLGHPVYVDPHSSTDLPYPPAITS